MIVVDARGLSCPEPVLLTKQAIQAGKFPIQVLLDTVTARENVRRMAEFSGCVVQVSQQGDEFELVLRKK